MKAKPQIQYTTDFKLCSKDHFLILKGISILLVVLVHFCSQYLNIHGLQPLQGVASAVFLLCSGYGVSESFKSKNGLPHYWENRAFRVWLPSLISIVVTALISGESGISWVAENPLALQGWFLYLLLTEYLVFWLAFYYLEDKKTRLLAVYAVSLCAFFLLKKQEVAVQVLSFPTGVLFSQLNLKYPVREMKTVGKMLLCVLLAALTMGAYFAAGILTNSVLAAACKLLCYMSAAVFLCFSVYFVRKIGIFGLFVPFGSMSYVLYLIHEAVLTLLKGRLEGRMIAAVFIGLFVAAAVLSWLWNLVIEWNKKLRRRKKTQLKGSMW